MSIDHTQENNQDVSVYSSESRMKHPLSLLKSIWNNFKQARELGWVFLIRDIKQRYRQSLLGFFWIFIPPIVTTVIFVFLNERKIINISPTDIPYPVYVLTGTILWQIFSESLNMPIKAFKSYVPIMIKINIPAEAPLLSGLGQVIFNLAIQFLVLIAILLFFDIEINSGLLLAIFPIIMLIMLGMTIGILMIPIGFLFQDIEQMLAVIVRLWFFVTPIVYPPPSSWPYSLVVDFNPVSPVLISARDLITKGYINDLSSLLVISVITFIVMVIGLVFYRLSIPIIIERAGA